MLGILNDDEIEQVLKKQFVGRIGCHANDLTYVVPISYTYEDNYVYARTSEGMKIQMMRKNPEVCFQVDDMQSMGHWKSVIAWGEYEELTDNQERNEALQKLVNRILPIVTSETVQFFPHWPFPPPDLSSIKGIIFRIKLKTKSGRFENPGSF